MKKLELCDAVVSNLLTKKFLSHVFNNRVEITWEKLSSRCDLSKIVKQKWN